MSKVAAKRKTGQPVRTVAERLDDNLRYGFKVGKSIAITQAMDMVVITLHEDFGFGADRIRKFHDIFEKNWHEMQEIGADDTVDKEYTKSLIDRRLKQAVPEADFLPWDERYEYDLDPKTKYPKVNGK